MDELEDIPISAVVTLVLFFFQLATVVHIEVIEMNTKSEQKNDNSGRMNQILFDIAAFRVSIYEELCPQDNGTLVTKMMMDMGLKISTVLNIFWFHILWKIFSCIVCKKKKTSPPSLRAEMEPIGISQLEIEIPSNDDQLSSTSILKIGFIKLFKLNFTSSATILLALIHC